MKHLGTLTATLLATLALAPFAQAETALGTPEKAVANFDRVYAPEGFDSNDVVQIVGEGMFENSCYRPAETSAKVDVEAKKIIVTPSAYKYPGICLQVVLPFERTIDVGFVPAGTYSIVQEGVDKVLGRLTVKAASRADADDFLYAPISQAMFVQKANSGQVVLQGNFMSDCMKLQDVKVDFQPDAIVVQPVVIMEERNNCQRGLFPFTKIVKTDKMNKGRFLLHVRSMNAKAINNIVDVK